MPNILIKGIIKRVKGDLLKFNRHPNKSKETGSEFLHGNVLIKTKACEVVKFYKNFTLFYYV
jgi:hypothetical protein